LELVDLLVGEQRAVVHAFQRLVSAGLPFHLAGGPAGPVRVDGAAVILEVLDTATVAVKDTATVVALTCRRAAGPLGTPEAPPQAGSGSPGRPGPGLTNVGRSSPARPPTAGVPAPRSGENRRWRRRSRPPRTPRSSAAPGTGSCPPIGPRLAYKPLAYTRSRAR